MEVSLSDNTDKSNKRKILIILCLLKMILLVLILTRIFGIFIILTDISNVFIYMPQLVPFFFMNQVSFVFILILTMLYIYWKYILPKFAWGNNIKFDAIHIWVIIALILINFFYRFSSLSMLISINMEQYFPLILGIIGVIIYILRCFSKEKDITYFGLIMAYWIGPIIFEISSFLIALGLPSVGSLILTLSTIGHSIWKGLLFSTPAGAGGEAPGGAGIGGNIGYVTGSQPSGPLMYLVQPTCIHYARGPTENGLIYVKFTGSPRDPGQVSNCPRGFTTPFFQWGVVRFLQRVWEQ